MAVLIAVTMSHLQGSTDKFYISHSLMNQYTGIPILSTNTGCAYQGLLGLSSLFWIPGLIFEPILLALVAWKAWGWKTDLRIPLVRKIARDR